MKTATDLHPIYDRKIDAACQYWLRALSADDGEAIIPIDRSSQARPPVENAIAFAISGPTFERLAKMTSGSPFLLYVTLLACVKTCLYKYSRNEVITVGGPPRSVEGQAVESSRVLAIVDNIDGGMSFRDLLLNIKQTATEAYQYQDYPLEVVADNLGLEEGRTFRPQVLVVVRDFHGDHSSFRSDLTLSFERDAAEVRGTVNFDHSLLSPDLIRRLTHDLPKILALALEDTTISIDDLSALTATERRRMLVEWNNTGRALPEHSCVHTLFACQSDRTPDAVAVTYEDRYLTYSELNRRANQLAHYLKAIGVKPEVRAALCLERSLEMVIGVLGVLNAGGVYVPLDPTYPPDRLSYMLNDAQAAVLITQQRLLSRLPAVAAQTVCLDREWERIGEESEREPENEVVSGNLAYVTYTSGSTGRPKGVMVEHGGLLNLAEAQKDAFRIGTQSRLLQFASLSFDASASEIFTALTAGASLHLTARENLIPGADLVKILNENRITVVTLPPTVLAVLAPEELPDLQSVVAAGEACTTEIVDQWARGRRFLNAYGPTEATVCASIAECEAGSHRRPTIGRPLANTRLYLLDHRMEPAPVEVRGSLYISGVGLARGYLGKPELTAERFVPDLFNSEGGGRLYRTGDVCRYLPDGKIEFVGRVDEQVKVRGYRIEPGEIEVALNEHRAVKQSAVTASKDEQGLNRLFGYVVVENGTTPAELTRHLRERLPEYMVPEAIRVLEEMPVTANGKIDRQRLPTMNDAGRRAAGAYTSARTPVEEILAGIFAEVLKVDRVGIHDNFFELGGHSLLATRMISRVRKAFGIELAVRTLFEQATVQGLGQKIEEAMGRGEKDEAPLLVRAPRRGPLPLSYAQQSLWFIDQLDPGNASYNIPGALRLEGKLNLEAMEAVINEIVKRHEVLRTRIEVQSGSPVQVTDEWERRRLEVVDLTSLNRKERAAELSRMMKAEARTAFDLSRGPLLRARILKLEEEEYVALFTMHHIVSDAWSIGVLVQEVSRLYGALSENQGSPLPELEIQYADYAFWQRQSLTETVLEKHLDYWRKRLGGKPPVLDLPADRSRPPVPSHRGATVSFALSPELPPALRRLSRQEGVTLFMLLLAAFKALLYKSTGQEDLVVGTAIANRTRSEIEPLIGFFVNMLPLRTDLSGNPRFKDLLQQVKEVALGGYAHQDLPFEKLVEELQPDRAVRQMPLLNVAFGVQNAANEELRLESIKVEPLTIEQGVARFDLTLWVTEGLNEIQIAYNYSTDLFEARTISRLHCHFETLLCGIVDRPDTRLSLLQISPKNETGSVRKAQSEWEDGKDLPKKRRRVNPPADSV